MSISTPHRPARATDEMTPRRLWRARAMCRRHGAPLLTMAAMLVGDEDAAGEIVAAVLTEAAGPGPGGDAPPGSERVWLARSVYHRCLGRLAARERFGAAFAAGRTDTVDRRPPGPTGRQCAVAALALYGGHDLAQTSRTLGLPEPEVVELLRGAVLSFAAARRRAPAG
ncbi:hypothetical protein [Spirilliplanes yamanashiensis]|uniref:Uncharacterized protein n=1 Tax=Spirilliplanes yamanashiensis TaxID=42233 RepID=A0A8J3Y6Y8_9ACTN|nr:hypothetical protein [Spirilliplanes yamanashiensis]MDP9817328.1 hypothetical protein [Spirilliplanes yamanashiensis]GIJ03021.1 hypothetical protein Sya03_23730 [Spirilliplanes yamanashiensis]